MDRIGGHMLHGVAHVEVLSLSGDEIPVTIKTDGRVYMWSNGAITVYREDQPWRLFPAHRVVSIVGKERG